MASVMQSDGKEKDRQTHLGLVMADVSGKGVPAALFMMVSKILVQNYAMTDRSPAEVLRAVNDQICANNREEMFVTVWFGILDTDTGKITAANAGHEYPVVMQGGGRFEIFKDQHGFVIGTLGVRSTKTMNYYWLPARSSFSTRMGCRRRQMPTMRCLARSGCLRH